MFRALLGITLIASVSAITTVHEIVKSCKAETDQGTVDLSPLAKKDTAA